MSDEQPLTITADIEKAALDALLTGSGLLLIRDDGSVEHIPAEKIYEIAYGPAAELPVPSNLPFGLPKIVQEESTHDPT